MSLELLSNEVLLYLCDFLDDVHLFRAFYGLNDRFDSLLFTSGRMYHLDFRSVSKHDFENIFPHYLTVVNNRISSIYLSNDDETPQLIEHFLRRSIPFRLFSNLRSLSFSHISSYDTIKEIIEECRCVPYLTHLRFIRCYVELNTEQYQLFLNNIWHLPRLMHCHIDISFRGSMFFLGPTITSPALEHLTVESVNFRSSTLSKVIVCTPRLRYLSIWIDEHFNNDNRSFTIPSLTSFKVYARDAAFAIEKLLKSTPNLSHLTVESLDTYLGNVSNVLAARFDDNLTEYTTFNRDEFSIHIDGHKWEEIIVNHLSKLKTFRLKMKYQRWTHHTNRDHVDVLLRSFSSHFWIQEARWFVQCDWNSNRHSPYFCFYTLPYSFNQFDINDAPMQCSSTSPNGNDYWSYNHVRELHYHSGLSDRGTLGLIRFGNICHLSIDLPKCSILTSVLPTLSHLKTLSVFITDDRVEAQDQLQMLIDRAPNLYALKISCGKLTASRFALFTIDSLSVRHLDLQYYTGHEGWYWFSSQQCAALCQSPLGRRCEMLRMNVENPMDVLELVYSMPNLRALHIRVSNDVYNILDTKSSSIEDDTLLFLRDSLDSTCIVMRDAWDAHFIHLWIR